MEETDDTGVVTSIRGVANELYYDERSREAELDGVWKKARKTTRTTTLSFPMMSIVIAGTKRTKAMQTRRPVSGRNESWSIATRNKTEKQTRRDGQSSSSSSSSGIHVVST